jgi:glycosyltransferase involved in cell wall biosynthesis
VAKELSRLQRQLGVDSELLSRLSTSIAQSPFQQPIVTGLAAMDAILTNKSKPTLFTHYRDLVSVEKIENFIDVDILHLHWTPGFINARGLAELSKANPQLRIIWTLHDMFPFTGGCHHAFECTGYQTDCSNCPQVRPPFKNKPFIALESKLQNLAIFKETSFVSPSNWIAERAKSSALLRGSKVSVIPNPLNSFFSNEPPSQRESRSAYGLNTDSLISILIAEDLADPNKAIQEFVNLASKLKLSKGVDVEVILVGRNADHIASADLNIHRLGSVTSEELSRLLPVADFLAVPSKMENAPSIVLEAASVGVPSLVNSENEGAIELAIGKQLGATFDPSSLTLDCVNNLVRLRRSNQGNLRKIALEYASGDVSARSYMNLYEKVLQT